ncbi:MAG: tRNA (adenosine(37)-N6)-threonylcarbamoyltransferase complex ATPase subunit type 1 TsaE [Acidobacteriota bacterium]
MRSESLDDTARLGGALGRWLAPDGVLLLDGPLGSGKTALVRGVAAGLGLAPDAIRSPSFTLIHIHGEADGQLVHIDLYRLHGDADAPASLETLDDLGLWELLDGPGVKAIEWGVRLGDALDALPAPPRIARVRFAPVPHADANEAVDDDGADARRRIALTGDLPPSLPLPFWSPSTPK